MIFGPKTTHYLRISRGTVLPLHLYLDDRHVEWMTERTLQYVLTDLRPLIQEKLEVERPFLLGVVSSQAAKQFASKVETYRGDSYQFGWWFTKAEPHAVVLKTRTFVQSTSATSDESATSTSEQRPRKRNRSTAATTRRSKRKATSEHTDNDDDPDVEHSNADADITPIDVDAVQDGIVDPIRPSSSQRVKVEEDQEQLQPQITTQASTRTVTVDFEMGAEEQDEKKKPVLQLNFKSFNTRIALCIVVEPYPPLPAQRRQPSIFSAAGIRAMTRAPSEAPSLLGGSREATDRNREPTPLFLPDFDRQSATPAPFFRQPSLPAVPIFDDGEPLLEDEGPVPDLMEFSHSVQATAAARGGTPEEDQVNDDVLYGDADDMRTGR